MSNPKIFPGAKFGDWTVIKYNSLKTLCLCICGVEKEVDNGNLVRGSSVRCRSCAGRRNLTRKTLHHLSNKVYMKLVICVNNVIRRYTDPTYHQWKNYGGRGITIRQEWLLDKRKFLEYLPTLPNFDNEKMVLDRIKNDGNYDIGNLRFVTRRISSLNRRKFGHLHRHGTDGRFVKKST